MGNDIRLNRGVTKEFGEMLKFLREGMDMSLKEVENLCGISSSYLCRLESSDKRAPTLPILVSLSRAYKISPLRLVRVALGTETTLEDAVDIKSLILSNNIRVNDIIINSNIKIDLVRANELILKKEWNRQIEQELLNTVDIIKLLKE